jgi:SAM-dependent methyltransferase
MTERFITHLKDSIRRHAPQWFLATYSFLVWNLKIRPRWRRMGATAVFTEHYRMNAWLGEESRSGNGSSLYSTRIIRAELPQLLIDFQVHSVLDIPCGDFNWMQLLDLPAHYVGADIVEEIIVANQLRYASPMRSFVRLDLTTDPLPKVDLVLCRDCLVHLSFRHIQDALLNIKRSHSMLLLATTHPLLEKNHDIVTGEWRRLNLQAPPFSLPKPVILIDEKCQDRAGLDKHLGLWRVSDIGP